MTVRVVWILMTISIGENIEDNKVRQLKAGRLSK